VIRALRRLIQDPPPAWGFELSEGAVAAARLGRPVRFGLRPLRPGVLQPSPVRDNVLEPDELAAQIQALTASRPGGKRQEAVLILPDASVRVLVLDFDGFPADPAEQLSLVRFRIKKGLPFELDSAALSYAVQPAPGKRADVVVAVTPLEVVARYEAVLSLNGLNPGWVTTSTLAALELVRHDGLAVLVKLSGRFLTVSVLQGGRLKLLRSIELGELCSEEVLAPLYPTMAYAEDQLGAQVERILLAGFGEGAEDFQLVFERELGAPVELLHSRYGPVEAYNAGLLGWLESLGERQAG